MLTKEKEILSEILQIYKDTPWLWNSSDPNYTNKEMRNQAWEFMYEKYKSLDNTANVLSVKKKMESLRATYKREHRKVKAAELLGTVYTPQLWHYKKLQFLHEKNDTIEEADTSDAIYEEKPQIATNPSTVFISCDNVQSTPNIIQYPNVTQIAPSSGLLGVEQTPLKRKKEQSYENEIKWTDGVEEEWEIIGKSIGIQLRGLEKTQQIIAQKLISDVLYYAKLGKLTENSSIIP